ncbi:MAG: hypothetical protein ACI4KA_10655 [Oscillospiraceae bacterium]
MEYVSGMVVISSAGHDSGGWFVVTGTDGRYVYIADGKERKLDAPKRKNTRHIRRTEVTLDISAMTDKALRRALNALRKQSITEESEKLV